MNPFQNVNRQYRDYTMALGAGQAVDIVVPGGDYWQIIAANGAVNLQFDNGSKITRYQGTGGPQDYSRVTVESDIAQTITIALGKTNGLTPYDSRATLAGAIVNVDTAVANDAESPADVAVGAASSAMLIGANAARRAVIVKNPSTSGGAVRVGKTASVDATHGIYLEAGESLTLEGNMALDVYNPNAFAISVSLIELRLL